MSELSSQWKSILDENVSWSRLSLENFRKLDICTSLQLSGNLKSNEIIAQIHKVKYELCKHLNISENSDINTICEETAKSMRETQSRRWEPGDNFDK
jgi:hypothetical protein